MTMSMKFNHKVYVLPAERYETMRQALMPKNGGTDSALQGQAEGRGPSSWAQESSVRPSEGGPTEDVRLVTPDPDKRAPRVSLQSISTPMTRQKIFEGESARPGPGGGSVNAASPAPQRPESEQGGQGGGGQQLKSSLKVVLEKVRHQLQSPALKHRAMAIHHHFMSCLVDPEQKSGSDSKSNSKSNSNGETVRDTVNHSLQNQCGDVVDTLKKWTSHNTELYYQMLLYSQSEKFPPPTKEKDDGQIANRQMLCIILECSVPLNLISNNRLRRTLHYMKLKWYNDSIYDGQHYQERGNDSDGEGEGDKEEGGGGANNNNSRGHVPVKGHAKGGKKQQRGQRLKGFSTASSGGHLLKTMKNKRSSHLSKDSVSNQSLSGQLDLHSQLQKQGKKGSADKKKAWISLSVGKKRKS